MAAPNLKIVVVGEGAVGKTSFCITFTSKEYPTTYTPTVFDNYSALYKSSKAGSTAINLGLWEVLQREDSARLRPLSYPQTDCFLLSFSVDNAASFEALFAVWIPEVTYHCPKAIFVVVGMKSDLRNDPTHLEAASKRYGEILPSSVTQKRALEAGAAAYLECSALKMEGLDDVIDTVVEKFFGTAQERKQRKKDRQLCVLQ